MLNFLLIFYRIFIIILGTTIITRQSMKNKHFIIQIICGIIISYFSSIYNFNFYFLITLLFLFCYYIFFYRKNISIHLIIIFLSTLITLLFFSLVSSFILHLFDIQNKTLDIFIILLWGIIFIFLCNIYSKKIHSLSLYLKIKWIKYFIYILIIYFLLFFLFYLFLGLKKLEAEYLNIFGTTLILNSIIFIPTTFILLKIANRDVQNFLLKKDEEYKQQYYIELEKNNNEIRKFRHDYRNVLLTINCYLADDQFDKDELQQYISELTEVSSTVLEKSKVVNLQNLNIPLLRGIIATKLTMANEQGIDTKVLIDTNLPKPNLSNIELTRLMSILLDNALEGTLEVENKTIVLVIMKDDFNNLIIKISNSFYNKNIDIENIHKQGVSTKGSGRGLGLTIAKEILNKNGGSITTEINNNQFIQIITLGGS